MEYRSNIKRWLAYHIYSLLLYGLSWIAIIFLYGIIKYETADNFLILQQTILAFIGDVFLLLSPYWLFANKYKWTVIFPIGLLSVFFLINIWYYRFWGNFLPTSSLLFLGNINGVLLNSVTGLLRWRDLFFMVPSCIVIIFLLFYNNKLSSEPQYTKSTKGLLFVISLFLFLCFYSLNLEKSRRWHVNEMGMKPSYFQLVKTDFEVPVVNPILYLNRRGVVSYSLKFLVDYFNTQSIFRELDEKEIAFIDDYLNNRNLNNTKPCFDSNKEKNVIFIIVESLNANVINSRIDNREITPFINSLIQEEGTIYSLDVRSEIEDCKSGDGQFIYNTGLLPLKGGATPLVIVPRNTFIPLAGSFKSYYNLGAVFADDGLTWNQKGNFYKYGFLNVLTQEPGSPAAVTRGADGAMFDQGLALIKTARQPFFLEMVTFSMHIPFSDPGVGKEFNWVKKGNLSETECNYLRMTVYFDSELKKFIEKLKQLNLYDNTILILASDHSQDLANHDLEREDNTDIPLVFIATNTGLNRRITKTVGQIDLYPTILEITGNAESPYKGIGVSMLDTVHNTYSDVAKAQKVSDLILIGDYFSKKH